jgi:Zinc knuckle
MSETTLVAAEKALPTLPAAAAAGRGLLASNQTKKKKGRRSTQKPKMTKLDRRAKYTAIARDRRTDKRFVNTTCFHCRTKGHTIQNCPKKKQEEEDDDANGGAATSSSSSSRICFRCGARDHSLADCPNETSDGSLPFATCFVCHGTGHLASACPDNEHGIFVNGGACRICQSTQHRAKTCPQNPKNNTKTKKDKKEKEGIVNNEDFSDLLLVSESANAHNDITKPALNEKQQLRVVKF